MNYTIGNIIMSPSPECVKFDMTDGGGIVYIIFDSPSAKEVMDFYGDTHLAFAVADDIIFLLVKLGNLSWMDAPYYRILSRNLTHLDEIPDGAGISFHLLFVDGKTGTLVSQKLISTQTEGSRRLCDAIKNQPYIHDYDRLLSMVMNMYSTKDLLSLATKLC